MTKLGLRGAGVLSLQLALTLFAACSSFDDSAGPPGSDDPTTAAEVDGGDAGDGGSLTGDASTPDKSLSIAPLGEVRITQGVAATIDVKVTRGAGLHGPVTVSIKGARDGITAAPLSMDGAEGKLTINVPLAAPQGKADATLVATADGVEASIPLPLFVRGPAGSLDTTFGKDGIVKTSTLATPAGLVALPKNAGFIVVGASTAGWPTAVRLKPDGTVDTTYGTGGVATIEVSSNWTAGSPLLQPDGKLLVGSDDETAYNTYVARFDVNGAPDGTFGNDAVGTGTVEITCGDDFARGVFDMALRPDGDLIVGFDVDDEGNPLVGTARLSPAGEIRTDFSGGYALAGLTFTVGVTPPRPFHMGFGEGLGLRNDPKGPDFGRIVVVATARLDHYGILQELANGGIDSSFQTNGARAIALPNSEEHHRAGTVQLANGTVVAPIHQDYGPLRLVSFLRNGDSDLTFGTAGVAGPFDTTGAPVGIAVDTGGTYVVASTAVQDAIDQGPDVRRFLPSGSPDTSFGDGGKVLTVIPSGTNSSAARDVVVQEDGRIVVLAQIEAGGAQTALVRYWD